jgi:hypothetical protein
MQLSLIRSNNMMHTITSTAGLKDAIRVLEETCAVQEKELHFEVREAIERLKPGNLARAAVENLATSRGAQHSLLQTAVGVATAFVSKRLLRGVPRGPVKMVAATFLQTAAAVLGVRYRTKLDIGVRNILLKLLGARTLEKSEDSGYRQSEEQFLHDRYRTPLRAAMNGKS